MEEEWRDVVGFEGLYQVSDMGHVKRLKACGALPAHSLKSASVSHNGYLLTKLFKDRQGRGFFIHRLVAAAFIGPLPHGLQVNHKDGNKLNNAPANLEYITCSANALHARRVLKRGPFNQGSQHGMAKLSEATVLDIRALAANGHTATSLAKRFGCARSIASRIIHRVIWKHV